MSKTVEFQTVKFSIGTLFSSVQPKNSTQSGVTNKDQSGPGSDGNKWVVNNPQSSNTSEASLSDGVMSFRGHTLASLTLLQRSSRCILQPQPIYDISE